MTNMAAMPEYGKNLKKSSSPEPIDPWPWNLVCSIMYGSTTKVVQIKTLGWSWPILRQGQIWSHRLVYGKKWKLFIFGTYCSFRSQSCLKHLAKWVYEVEWVSKVKVILWSWSKVTQISKLNVWLLACILRWAIQGLRALLFYVMGKALSGELSYIRAGLVTAVVCCLLTEHSCSFLSGHFRHT